MRIEPIVSRFEDLSRSDPYRFVAGAAYLEEDPILALELNFFIIDPPRHVHRAVHGKPGFAVEPMIFFYLNLNGHQPSQRISKFEFRNSNLFWLVLHDVTGNRGRSNSVWRAQVHRARAAAPRKIAVLRAYYNLFLQSADAGAGVDTGAAARLDDLGAHLLQHFNIASLLAMLSNFNRTELNETLYFGTYVLTSR